MPNILLKAENAGAERLWNYIMAYRRMVGEIHQTSEEISSKNNVILGLMPMPEQTRIIARPKKSIKKYQ